MSPAHSIPVNRQVVRTNFGSGLSGPSYRSLMQVEIRHGFYNATDGRCHDFEIRPTAATTTLMQSIGLLFRSAGTSFSILVDRNRERDLAGFIERSAQQSGAVHRLAFLLTPTTPYFVNFTDMPVSYSPSQACYYFSNASAKEAAGGEMLLDPDFPADAPLRPTGSQYEVQVVEASTNCVTLQDSQGKVVAAGSVPGPVRPQQVFLSLAGLPEGKYTVGECDSICRDCVPAGITPRGRVLYVVSSSQPFCMIDLFLSDPGNGGGTYPVSGGQVKPVEYCLRFQPRQTTWNYYVVSRGAPLQDLRIVQEPSTGMAAALETVTFQGPEMVVLPTRQLASRFVSESPIPLLRQSIYNFQLRGQIGFQEVRNGVLMGRMPVASCRQVIPGAGDFATGGRGRPSPVSAQSLPPQSFSDIYVYV